MSKTAEKDALQAREDEVLRCMLATPPERHKAKAPATKKSTKKTLKKKPA